MVAWEARLRGWIFPSRMRRRDRRQGAPPPDRFDHGQVEITGEARAAKARQADRIL